MTEGGGELGEERGGFREMDVCVTEAEVCVCVREREREREGERWESK